MADKVVEEQIPQHHKHFLLIECCFWIYNLIFVMLGLTIFFLVIKSYQSTQDVLETDTYAHAQQTVALWEKGYIIDIKVQNTNNCPEGYEALVNHDWQGTEDGCYCTAVANSYNLNFVLIGKCNSDLISQGCTTVNSQPSRNLNMWKGSKLICYKRASSMNFYNSILTDAPTGGTSVNMSVCAENQTHQVYTLPSVSCPITATSNASIGGTHTSLTLDSSLGYQLNFAMQTGYPIADFKLTQYSFCQFFKDDNISPNKTGTYALENQKKQNPCSGSDSRMVTIDILNEEDFYTNNTRFYDLITSTLPAYPTPSPDYNYLLGYIPYPTWTYQCRITDRYSLNIATSKLKFKDSQQFMRICAGVVLTCLFIAVILMRIFYIVRHVIELKNKHSFNAVMLTEDQIQEQIPNLAIKKSFKKQFLLFLIELSLLLTSGALIIYTLQVFTEDSVWIKQAINYGCTDDYIINIFRYYENVVDANAITLLESLFVWIVLLTFEITYFIIRTQKGDLVSKEEPEQQSVEQIIIDKQLRLEGDSHQNLQESSSNLNEKGEQHLKIQDLDFLMGNYEQTQDNFYNGLQNSDYGVLKKKKKRKGTKKLRRNLFKE